MTDETMQPGPEIEQVFVLVQEGDKESLDQAFKLLEKELKKAAHFAKSSFEYGVEGLSRTTALVNELYMKWARQKGLRIDTQKSFIAFANRAMKNILKNQLEAVRAAKRGRPDQMAEDFDCGDEKTAPSILSLSVQQAIEKYAQVQPENAALIQFYLEQKASHRSFTYRDLGEYLNLKEDTVRKKVKLGLAFIKKELELEKKRKR